MENQISNQTPVVPNNAPAAAAPPAAPASTVPASATPPKSPTSLPVKTDSAKTNRFFYGCCSFFGCSLLLFLIVIFVFIGAGGSSDNPIFGLFGVSGPQVVNLIGTLTNLIFGFLAFVAFIVTVIGAFKFASTKKTEKENRKKAMLLTFGAFGILVLLVFMWIFAYLFLKSRQVVVQQQVIVTEPVSTLDLTSPITVKFDASNLPINPKRFTILTYEWDFGDGETRTGGEVQTHQYVGKGKTGGRFDVKLTVTAKEIGTNAEKQQVFAHTVTVANEQATAVIEANPERGEAPLAVEFDASKSKDPDGEIQSFAWDTDDDGQFDDGDAPEISKTFEAIGTYKVKLQITESNGANVVAEKTVYATASNAPTPVIDIDGATNDTIATGKTYTFSAANSSSPLGVIKKYEWEMGDGTKKQTRSITYFYEKPGTYEVTLTVTDETGKSASLTKKITVANPAATPIPVLKTTPESVEGKIEGSAPLQVAFDASQTTDADNDIVEYQWDFQDDGTSDVADLQTNFTYQREGAYTAALTVRDAAGNAGKATVQIVVTAPGIRADVKAEPSDGEIPLEVAFDASGSSYPNHRIVSYEWNFGDETAPIIGVAKISHKYTKIGSFTAQVTVRGNDQKTATASANINVRPISLKACFTPTDEEGKAPLEVIFDPSCSTGTAVKYKWDFGGKGTSRDRKPTFTFEQAGSYNVVLEVTDSSNVVDRFTKTITVTK